MTTQVCFIIAIVPTACGIETEGKVSVPIPTYNCNSTYRLRY